MSDKGVYRQLLLSAGGGIVSVQQQANQVRDTATILIGLGGTGMDAIRTIKTQVYSRIKPDNPDSPVPAYEHIRFLGVDAASMAAGDASKNDEELDKILALDETEFFDIGCDNLKAMIENKEAMDRIREADWFQWENISIPMLGKAGAGGIRQVGRFMFMERSRDFMNRLRSEIRAARMDLNTPTLNIHIFTGLGGGTGSGIFLDVCYLVREITRNMAGTTVFGYFFLPDVNLSRIPTVHKAQDYVPRNGFAAMQELDYCMRLEENGGRFYQTVQGGEEIAWNKPPVDMAHLIASTDSSGRVIPDAYNYAMNVAAEYLMDFLIQPSGNGLDLSQQLANFKALVNNAKIQKDVGVCLDYAVIGASCASLPLKEINTYLASEVFNQFSQIGTRIPGENSVEQLAVKAIGSYDGHVSGIYDFLMSSLKEGADTGFTPYPNDWRTVRDYGNSDLVTHYTNQRSDKDGAMEKNCRSLASETNTESLINRIRRELQIISEDFERGPVFAYGLLNASEKNNLSNIVDGLIETNKDRWEQEKYQYSLRKSEYETAKKNFETRKKDGMFDSDAKRFERYEDRLRNLITHFYETDAYEKMNTLLLTLKKQITDLTNNYYLKLSTVMRNLIQTFQENRNDLNSESFVQSSNYNDPLITIEDLRPTLKAECEEVNIPGALRSFMAMLFQNEGIWITEEEGQISKLVNDFFVKNLFANFANQTINSFLEAKHKVVGAPLASKIYTDHIVPLKNKATPLFPYNNAVWNEHQSSKMSYVHVPQTSDPIQQAAQRLHNVDNLWNVSVSDLTDRISVMCTACALPLSGYLNSSIFESKYYRDGREYGRHYYEGKPHSSQPVLDWYDLAPLTPICRVDSHNPSTPALLSRTVEDYKDLYQKGKNLGILQIDRTTGRTDFPLYLPDEEWMKNTKDALQQKTAALETQDIKAVTEKEDIDTLQDISTQCQHLEQEIAQAMQDLPLLESNHKLKTEGSTAGKAMDDIPLDNFAASPYFRRIVSDAIETMDQFNADLSALEIKVHALSRQAADALTMINQNASLFNDYCQAIFSGVITVSLPRILYSDEFGEEIVLSRPGDQSNFPHSRIPVYQGYKSFENLSMEERLAIKTASEEKYSEISDDLMTNGSMLKGCFDKQRVDQWIKSAAAEKSDAKKKEKIKFVRDFKNEFDNFCLDFDIQ